MCGSILCGFYGGGVSPGMVPENLVALEQGPGLANGGRAVFVPEHARSFQALVDNRLARRFDLPGADLPTAGRIRRAVGHMLIARQIRPEHVGVDCVQYRIRTAFNS